jgi:excisionase family DNA binding protein
MKPARPFHIEPDQDPDIVVVDTPVPATVTAALAGAGYRLAAQTARHAIYTPGGPGAIETDTGEAQAATGWPSPQQRRHGDKGALSVTEAAAVLGVSRSHAYELVRTGGIPHLRLGRRILIPKHSLHQLLSA